jgi:salicylate hydroxylase
MASSRNVVIAGAGIGGLTAALMLAQAGFRVTLLEQAARLSETGAGIQLSPNATHILIALGIGERLRSAVFEPEAVAIKTASGGRLARIPLGAEAERRYSAPYWSIHRADLQGALLEAVLANPDIVLRLDTRLQDFVEHANGLSIACRHGSGAIADERAIALIGADGLWSVLRSRLGHPAPEFQRRTAWRALVAADSVDPEFRTPDVQLWLGRDAHVVHYPVRSGTLINVVAIVDDDWSEPGWSAEGQREALLAHYSPWNWALPLREFLAVPGRWQKWALYDLPPLPAWGEGPVTLLGDAAHPMLPFLAQGACMAIEDAAVLADQMASAPDDPAAAMRRYERSRRKRTARVQRAAHSNGRAYHLGSGEALARNLFLRLAGGKMLLRRYNWLYDWRTPPPRSAPRQNAPRGASDGKD